MTDADKHALSARVAAAAEKAGLPQELVWERAWECPAGHVMTGRAVNDTCIYYDDASRQVCGLDVRHSRLPLDLTDPAYLLPLVKEWLRRKPEEEGWTYQVAWCDGQAVGNIYELVNRAWGRHYHGADKDSEWVSLAIAFEAALQVEPTDG